jgi:hypothetical protein
MLTVGQPNDVAVDAAIGMAVATTRLPGFWVPRKWLALALLPLDDATGAALAAGRAATSGVPRRCRISRHATG